MHLDKVLKLIKSIDGWLTNEEGKLLYNLAKNCKKGAIVEIGSWKGKSTICLGSGSLVGKKLKVYAIDPHTGSDEQKIKGKNIWTFDEFKKNIKNVGLDDMIVPIVKTSKEASDDFDEDVGLLFIDGDHSYDMVKLDFDLWYPKVRYGGIIAFHDSTNYDSVAHFVRKYVYKSNNFKNVGLVGSITFGQKVTRNSLADRIRNRAIYILSVICSIGFKLKLPRSIKFIGEKLIALVQRK